MFDRNYFRLAARFLVLIAFSFFLADCAASRNSTSQLHTQVMAPGDPVDDLFLRDGHIVCRLRGVLEQQPEQLLHRAAQAILEQRAAVQAADRPIPFDRRHSLDGVHEFSYAEKRCVRAARSVAGGRYIDAVAMHIDGRFP